FAERVARRGRMELPRHHDVARRVADAHRSPVDHAADAAVPDEPVTHVEVAVVPDGCFVPGWCSQCAFPFGGDAGIAVEHREPRSDLRIAFGQADAAAGRCPVWTDLLHRRDERGEIACSLDRIDLLHRQRVSLDPAVDLPEPGIAVARAALRHREGNVDGQQWGQLRQPVELAAPRLRRAAEPRQPYGELIPEPEDCVDRAARLEPAERQVRPLRKLVSEEEMRKRLVDRELVDVHRGAVTHLTGSVLARAPWTRAEGDGAEAPSPSA